MTYVLDKEDKEQDSIKKNNVAAKKFWKPQPDDFVVSAPEEKKDTPAATASVVMPTDSTMAKVTETAPAVHTDDTRKIEESFLKRKSILSKELIVESDSVELNFYDNGDIDGDSISVFLNSRAVLTHKGLSAKAINLYMLMDSTKEVNEVSMFAENLGSIPPNTALMVVSDGVHRYEVYMSSSLTQNSAVRLRRKKK